MKIELDQKVSLSAHTHFIQLIGQGGGVHFISDSTYNPSTLVSFQMHT